MKVRDRIRIIMPVSILSAYRITRELIRRFTYRGELFFCNVCFSNINKWIHAGPKSHMNFVCPVCFSYGRHRFIAMILEEEIDYNDATHGGTLIHFSPEIGLSRWVKNRYPNFYYKSSDFSAPACDFQLDLEELDLPNESVDYIILSHVLEHINNDAKAVAELFRVLSPRGKVFIQVPLGFRHDTIDDKLWSAKDRFDRYGKSDHVRLYGRDIIAKLEKSGFCVTVFEAKSRKYDPYFFSRALDIGEKSTMIYSCESTTFVCCKSVS